MKIDMSRGDFSLSRCYTLVSQLIVAFNILDDAKHSKQAELKVESVAAEIYMALTGRSPDNKVLIEQMELIKDQLEITRKEHSKLANLIFSS